MNHDLASTYLSCLVERKDHSAYRPVFRHVALFAVSRKPSFFMPTCYSLCPKWLSASFYISWFWDKIYLLLQNLHPTFPLIHTPAVECPVPSVHFPFPVAALLFLLRLAVAPEPLSHSIRAASFHHSRVSMQVWRLILSCFVILCFTNEEHREGSCPCLHWIHRLLLTTSHWILRKYVLAQSSL